MGLTVFLFLTIMSLQISVTMTVQPLLNVSIHCEPIGVCNVHPDHPFECMRQNQVYSVKGDLCVNSGEKGLCHMTEPLTAINFGSLDPVEHPEGILYVPETLFPKNDKNGIYLPLVVSPDPIIAPPPYKPLLQTGIIGNPNICSKGIDPCIIYELPTKHLTPGQYEIALRFIQAPPNPAGYRRFNAFLSGKLLVQDFDLMKMSDQPFFPITVYLSMVVEGHMMRFGQSSYLIENPLQLAFCYGACGEPKGFIIAGFHIIKHGNQPSCNKGKCDHHKKCNKTSTTTRRPLHQHLPLVHSQHHALLHHQRLPKKVDVAKPAMR